MPVKKQLKPKVLEMLKLKRSGLSLLAISKKFKCHHSNISYHLRKLGKKYPLCKVGAKKKPIEKKQKKYQKSIALKPTKTYEDYLEIEKKRVDSVSRLRH